MAGILEMFAARGESAVTLYLPFSASSPQQTDSAVVWHAKGWWATSGGRVATAVLEATNAKQGGIYEWAVWDGSRSTLGGLKLDQKGVESAGALEGAILLSTDVVQIGRMPFPGPLSRAWLPTELGWGLANQPWGRYLKSMVDVRTHGREFVRGVDCIRLSFDMGGQPGTPVFPWTLWIDDRDSFLVLRTVSYHSVKVTPPEDLLTLDGIDAIEISGETWRPIRAVEVLEWRDLECGLRIGTRGTVRNAIRSLVHLDADIEVESSRAICGPTLDQRLFTVMGRQELVDPGKGVSIDPERGKRDE